MNDLMVYEGNWPGAVSRDAKYSVRRDGEGGGGYVVGIEYRTDFGQRWHPTTDAHDELVKMVNKIKIEVNDVPGGSFYINEHRQVIVPAGMPVIYYLGGEYDKDLIFEFDGYEISGRPCNLNGNPLSSGDEWEGAHAGIPYVLKAGGRDIYYKRQIRPRVTQDFILSYYVGNRAAQRMAAKIRNVFGHFNGGCFYINEFRQLFTGMPYIYIGELGTDDPWFPKPHS